MPGLTKVASYSTESLFQKGTSHSTPKTMYRSTSTRNLPSGETSETPSLPRISLMHGSRPPPQSGQWSFLHALLSQDDEEQAGVNDNTDWDLNEDVPTHSSTPVSFRARISGQRHEDHSGDSVWAKERSSKQKTISNAPSKLQPISSSSRSNSRKSRTYNSSGRKHERRTSGDTERKTSGHTETQVPVSASRTFTPSIADNEKSATASDTKTVTTMAVMPSEGTISQWTTCRALPDLDEDNTSDNPEIVTDPDDQVDPAVTATTDPIPARAISVSLSRATSTISVSGLPRRKRPLLLPPIMLPPIYTVKPTPLRFRDSLLSMDPTSSSRSRRSITDEEWEQLKDCRYIRHRPFKPPVSLSVTL